MFFIDNKRVFKINNLNHNMFPFKNKNTQRVWSIVFVIVGVLIMIIKPVSGIVEKIGLNAFITGLILAFVGFFYFMDIQ